VYLDKLRETFYLFKLMTPFDDDDDDDDDNGGGDGEVVTKPCTTSRLVCHSKRSCAYEPRSWDFIVIVNRKT
jgi:hypothetical protein